MANNGHYGSILQSIALEKEHDREALILAKRAEIQARRLAKKRPLLPSEMLRDVFAFANRFVLDALQVGTRRFDSVVQSMCEVCLRRIDHIWLTASYVQTTPIALQQYCNTVKYCNKL
ncbi:hypothetical protein AAVH_20999 [Aphelenchoides avenae]|nr:hypothetical protein AAVH_20999 [Aphelenchus avenae]